MATAPRIYQPGPLHAGQQVLLDAAPAHHLTRVLRRGRGDRVILFNGQGGEYDAEILAVDRSQARLRLLEHRPGDRESPFRIHLGQALSQPRKFDQVLQKATELGVASVTPVNCRRCSIRLDARRGNDKMAHWQGVLVSACEQCGRNRVPALHAATDLADWLQAQPGPILYLQPGARPGLPKRPEAGECSLLIGPEGGFDADELGLLDAHPAATGLALGPRILRTETAPVAALAILQQCWGDLG